jgi:hypothetical protein
MPGYDLNDFMSPEQLNEYIREETMRRYRQQLVFDPAAKPVWPTIEVDGVDLRLVFDDHPNRSVVRDLSAHPQTLPEHLRGQDSIYGQRSTAGSWNWNDVKWEGPQEMLVQGAKLFILSPEARATYNPPSDDAATGKDILTEFFNAVGPTERHFGNNSFMTQVISIDPNVVGARAQAYDDYFLGGKTGHYRIEFVDRGFFNFLQDVTDLYANVKTNGAIGNMGFIGSFSGWAESSRLPDPNRFQLHFHLDNTTSKQSGAGIGPTRSIKQVWDWIELMERFDPTKYMFDSAP